MKPLGDTVFLGAVPLPEARPAIESSLSRFARVSAYESWLAKAQEQALDAGDLRRRQAARSRRPDAGRPAPVHRGRIRIGRAGTTPCDVRRTSEEVRWHRRPTSPSRNGISSARARPGRACSFRQRPELLRQLQGGRLAREASRGRPVRRQRADPRALERARDRFRPDTSSPQEIESETLDALRSAVATLESKAPEEVEAYKVVRARARGERRQGGRRR